MLAVKEQQTVHFPLWLLRAIGEGVMVAEVRELEDLAILLEWCDLRSMVENMVTLASVSKPL